jgi:hypothetical protein
MFAVAIKNSVIMLLIIVILHFLLQQALRDRQEQQDVSKGALIEPVKDALQSTPVETPTVPAVPTIPKVAEQKPKTRNPKEEELYRFVFASAPIAECADTKKLQSPVPEEFGAFSSTEDVVLGGGLQAFAVEEYCPF